VPSTPIPDLQGRTAVVTGASSGIGRAVAERLGAGGAHVVLGGRTAKTLDRSAKAIETAGGSARVVVSDIRDPAAAAALVAAAVEDTGQLDLLVNNAGIAHLGPVVGADPEHWRAMLETNLLALLAGTSAAVQAMRAHGGGGHIVNISSSAALRPDSGVYGATKHAVNVIGESLRKELVDDPIQVVTIMPGATLTNFGRHLDPEVVQGFAAMTGADITVVPGEHLPDDVLEAGREALSDLFVSPEDIADAVVYAISRPAHVHVAEVVVRPNRDLDLA
jgi:NADP-dependent 3-hydroxy acid dehydrogenase YdfG